MLKLTEPKKVLCIHDLSGVGRCSLAVILPVLSVMGVQPVALPTVVLSTHTGGFGTPARLDGCDYGMAALEHYRELGLEFDCIYTGYLGGEAQAAIAEKAFDLWPAAKKVVDPVMGDNGKAYSTVTPEFIDRMRTLCQRADLILPNVTEAGLLLRKETLPENFDEAGAQALADELTTLAADIYSKSEREVYIARMAEKTGISAAALSEDAAKKAKKAEEKQKAERRRQTVNATLGYGDRINRDRLTYATGALLEERLLACMLSNPALAAEACKSLSEDDFLTAFGRKVFTTFAEEFSDGTEVVLSKDGALTPEEISALARLMAKHDRLLSVMPDDVGSLVGALKTERQRIAFNERREENPQDALEEYIRLKRQKKTRPGDGGEA